MEINRILELLEKYLPALTAMDGDRIGLQLQSGRNEVNSLLITMELNEEVVSEAIKNGNECIITFHPLIFYPLVSITGDNRVGNLIDKMISNRIALISIHTNFDSYKFGTSYIFASKLGFDVSGFLEPSSIVPGYGMGVVCNMDNPIQLDTLLERVQLISSSPLRFVEGQNNFIKNIGIVCGSGSSFIDKALELKLDVLITADLTYHHFHKCKGRLSLIDTGHYEMEQFVPEGLYELLKSILDNNIKLNISQVHTNPVSYFPENGFKNMQINNLLINQGLQ
jgi:dinuclear metal center YbgI/SA1388 family protein